MELQDSRTQEQAFDQIDPAKLQELSTFSARDFVTALRLVDWCAPESLDGGLEHLIVELRANTLRVAAGAPGRLMHISIPHSTRSDSQHLYAVSRSFIEGVEQVYPVDEMYTLSAYVDDEDRTILVIYGERDRALIQPTVSTQPLLRFWNDLHPSETTTIATVDLPPLIASLDEVPSAEVTLAFTPRSVIVRTPEGPIGAPLPATLEGSPTRADFGVDLLQVGLETAMNFGCESVKVHAGAGKFFFESEVERKGEQVGFTFLYLLTPGIVDEDEDPPPAKGGQEPIILDLTAIKVPSPAPEASPVDLVLEQFEDFIGQKSLKQQIQRISAQVELSQKRSELGLHAEVSASHMVFSGPPGTGKTTVARLFADLYHSLGLLPTNKLVEVDRQDLVAAHIGGTEEKTAKAIEDAMGGVLFIDEAYSLAAKGSSNDFGPRALETLMTAMEDHRGEFVCIVAGYSENMADLMSSNPGLSSRFKTNLEFVPFTTDELCEIAEQIAHQRDNTFSEEALQALRSRLRQHEEVGGLEDADWANARSIRNLVDEAEAHLGERVTAAGQFSREALQTITAADIESACDAFQIGRAHTLAASPEDILAELQAIIGQEDLKREVETLVSSQRILEERRQRGIEVRSADIPHILFIGPPGTGKTTVARLLARLYHALGILPSDRVMEVDRSDLVGEHIGQTAIKTQQVIDHALGGVLFIDEAYTLASDSTSDFGREAVDTLLKRMSDDAGRFLVIAAGYPDKMSKFLDSNPGLRRRFGNTITFRPYSAGDLLAIAEHMIGADGQSLTEEARAHLAHRLTSADQMGVFAAKDWGNAGAMRNLISLASRERDRRIASLEADSLSAVDLNALGLAEVEYACDAVLRTASLGTVREDPAEVLSEINAQIGQPGVKAAISSLIATLRAREARRAAGIDVPDLPNPHLVFAGPPGTGKTTFARLISRLYAALGVLPGGAAAGGLASGSHRQVRGTHGPKGQFGGGLRAGRRALPRRGLRAHPRAGWQQQLRAGGNR